MRDPESAFQKPVRRLGREHEQFRELQLARARLDLVHQCLAVALAAEVRLHRERGQFAQLVFRKRVQRRAADDVAVVLGDDEALDLAFEALARPAHQHALLLQRLDDAGEFRRRRRSSRCGCARARSRRPSVPTPSRVKSLEQQRAVVVAADEVRALDAVVARADRGWQVDPHVAARALPFLASSASGVGCRRSVEQLPAAVAHAVGIHRGR